MDMAQPVMARSHRRHDPTAREGSGWLMFAAVMFFAAAAVNGIYGFVALAKDNYFAADELVFGDLGLWGAIYLCLAAAAALAGFLILFRKALGSLIGLGLALVHGTLTLLSIGAYPLWSVIMLVIDGVIIYALCIYGF